MKRRLQATDGFGMLRVLGDQRSNVEGLPSLNSVCHLFDEIRKDRVNVAGR